MQLFGLPQGEDETMKDRMYALATIPLIMVLALLVITELLRDPATGSLRARLENALIERIDR